MRTKLSIGASAVLNWLPQETILFDQCALDRRLDVHIETGAQFTICEPVVFGRAAMGEKLTSGLFRDEIRISKDGEPYYVDRSSLHGNIGAQLARPWIANGAGAMALIVHSSPLAESHLPNIRAMLPTTAGASLLPNGLLIIRTLASDRFELRRTLTPLLERLTNASLPRTWIL